VKLAKEIETNFTGLSPRAEKPSLRLWTRHRITVKRHSDLIVRARKTLGPLAVAR